MAAMVTPRNKSREVRRVVEMEGVVNGDGAVWVEGTAVVDIESPISGSA